MSHHFPGPKRSARTRDVISMLLAAAALLWLGSQVLGFGSELGAGDLIGGYLVVSVLAVFVVLRTGDDHDAKSRIALLISALAIPALVISLGQFWSGLDPEAGADARGFPSPLRWPPVVVAGLVLCALGPRRFLDVPRWLLLLACLVTTGWLFAYLCPSIAGEWCSPRTGPAEFLPQGLQAIGGGDSGLDVQDKLLWAPLVAWTAVILVGRIRFLRAG